MERLTTRKSDFALPKRGNDAVSVLQCVDRLATIEDILGDDYDLDRLRELVEAERDGRCVVLPCKVGDTAWFKTYSCNAKVCHGIQPHTVKAIRFYAVVEGKYTDVGLSSEQFNKSWFLAPEAAEAALKGEQHENQT